MIDDIVTVDKNEKRVPIIIIDQDLCVGDGMGCCFPSKYDKECLGYVIRGEGDIDPYRWYCSLRVVE